jgi:hypothetical protein
MRIGQVLLIVAVVGTDVSAALTRSPERALRSAGGAVGSEPTLAEVRQATERFRDVNVALEAGYIRDPSNMRETAEMMGRPPALGAMGIHYFRPDLLGITAPPSPGVNGS